jgi:hypothetical protein
VHLHPTGFIRKLWADGRNVLEGTQTVDERKPVHYKLKFELELEGESIDMDPLLNVTIQVNPPVSPLVITDVNGNVLADGATIALVAETVGVLDPGQVIFKASGGKAPYNFVLQSGAIPVGDTITSVVNPDTSETVSLSGTPTAVGSAAFALLITDSSTPAQAAKVGVALPKKIA